MNTSNQSVKPSKIELMEAACQEQNIRAVRSRVKNSYFILLSKTMLPEFVTKFFPKAEPWPNARLFNDPKFPRKFATILAGCLGRADGPDLPRLVAAWCLYEKD